MSCNTSNFSVGFIVVGDETTASTRHRVLDPIEHFSKDINTDVLSFYSHRSKYSNKWVSKIVFVARMFLFSFRKDIIYIQKIPLPGIVIRIIEFIGGKVVFDFDDALYTSPDWEEDDPERRSRLKQSLEASTAVFTGNPNLSSFARRYNDNIYTLPTPVPKENRISTETESDQVTIGWIGSPGNLRYLQLIEEPLDCILENCDTELVIVTGEDRPVDLFEENDDVRYISWSLEEERGQLAKFDLVVRPMSDTEWINGKGGYTSVIRCMSLGLPVIASPISPLKELTSPGDSILFASTPEEWHNMLEYLICNVDFRNEVGKKARQEVETQKLWTEDYASRLQRVLKSVLHTDD